MTMQYSGDQVTFSDASIQKTAATGFGFKNRLFNGDMRFWRRGTSFTNQSSGGTPTYTAERWTGWRGGYATGQNVSQQAGFNGFQYCLRLQRAAGNTSTANLAATQIIESNNCYDLAGQKISIGFFARAGSNYSGGALGVTISTGTGTDQGSLALAGSTWTTYAITSVLNATLTTTGTFFSGTVTVPAGTTELGMTFGWTPTGTAGTNDYVEITGVQLEMAPSATAFDTRAYGTDLVLNSRYYQRTSGGYGLVFYSSAATTTSFILATTQLPVQMRVAPTVTIYDGATANKCVAMIYTASFAGNSITPYGYGSSGTTSVSVNLYNTSAYGVRGDYEADAEL